MLIVIDKIMIRKVFMYLFCDACITFYVINLIYVYGTVSGNPTSELVKCQFILCILQRSIMHWPTSSCLHWSVRIILNWQV